jgi:hypothetical protein
MHTEINFWELVFRLSLFSLLAYKLIGLIKTTAIPYLSDQILQERKQQSELLDKEKLLVSTQQRLKNQIYNQKQMFILLEKNVHEWYKINQEYNVEQENQNAEIIKKIEQKRTSQRQNIILLNNVQLSIPQALEQAREELGIKYSGTAGKELLSSVVRQLPNNLVNPQ